MILKIKDPSREGKTLRYTVENYFYNKSKHVYEFTDKFGDYYSCPEHMFIGTEPERKRAEGVLHGKENEGD